MRQRDVEAERVAFVMRDLRAAELACNPGCGLANCSLHNKDSAFNFVRQAAKWRVAYGDLLSWQRARGAAAEWIVKVRPDLLWFEPLPLTFLEDAAASSRGAWSAEACVRVGARVLGRGATAASEGTLAVPGPVGRSH